jgi:hypothetical protein
MVLTNRHNDLLPDFVVVQKLVLFSFDVLPNVPLVIVRVSALALGSGPIDHLLAL